MVNRVVDEPTASTHAWAIVDWMPGSAPVSYSWPSSCGFLSRIDVLIGSVPWNTVCWRFSTPHPTMPARSVALSRTPSMGLWRVGHAGSVVPQPPTPITTALRPIGTATDGRAATPPVSAGSVLAA